MTTIDTDRSSEISDHDPLDAIPHRISRREGRSQITHYACFMILLARDPLTLKSVHDFIASLPRHPEQLKLERWKDQYCAVVMERAALRVRGTPYQAIWDEAFSYITLYLPMRKWDSAEMLIETVTGVLGGLSQGIDLPQHR